MGKIKRKSRKQKGYGRQDVRKRKPRKRTRKKKYRKQTGGWGWDFIEKAFLSAA